jgi:hypothetical protein
MRVVFGWYPHGRNLSRAFVTVNQAALVIQQVLFAIAGWQLPNQRYADQRFGLRLVSQLGCRFVLTVPLVHQAHLAIA